MKKLQVTIKGMHCEGCANNIKKGLSDVEGVGTVAISVKAEKATISYDEKSIDEQRIMDTIESMGYDTQ